MLLEMYGFGIDDMYADIPDSFMLSNKLVITK